MPIPEDLRNALDDIRAVIPGLVPPVALERAVDLMQARALAAIAAALQSQGGNDGRPAAIKS